MTDRIRGFNKPLGHARTQSDKPGQKGAPDSRVQKLKEETRKGHARASSNDWKKIKITGGEGGAEAPSTPRLTGREAMGQKERRQLMAGPSNLPKKVKPDEITAADVLLDNLMIDGPIDRDVYIQTFEAGGSAEDYFKAVAKKYNQTIVYDSDIPDDGVIREVIYDDDGGVKFKEVPIETVIEESSGEKSAENSEPENLSFAEKRAVFEQQASSAPAPVPEKSANHAPEPEKLRKGPEIPGRKMPTAGEPESHVGLPEVDVIPEITTARPNVDTPRRQMAGHARNASDQLGLKEKKTTEKRKKMFEHRRIVTDRHAPGGEEVKIGNRTPRTPREARPPTQASASMNRPPRDDVDYDDLPPMSPRGAGGKKS